MQNGNPKKETVEQNIAALIRNYKPLDGKKATKEEINQAMEAFEDLSKKGNAPSGCFFLKPEDLSKLLGVPNFRGISIYIGKDDKGDEVLILVPAITGSDLQNVYTITYSTNDSLTTETESTAVTLPAGPCPPYPAGCTYCCPRQ